MIKFSQVSRFNPTDNGQYGTNELLEVDRKNGSRSMNKWRLNLLRNHQIQRSEEEDTWYPWMLRRGSRGCCCCHFPTADNERDAIFPRRPLTISVAPTSQDQLKNQSNKKNGTIRLNRKSRHMNGGQKIGFGLDQRFDGMSRPDDLATRGGRWTPFKTLENPWKPALVSPYSPPLPSPHARSPSLDGGGDFSLKP